MSVALHADARDFLRLARVLDRIPMEIKARAFSSAMRRTVDQGRTRIVKRSAERVDLPQRMVRERTQAYNRGSAAAEIVMRSKWIPLYTLGARQTRSGVTVKLRGSYKSAFIASMKSGHAGVFKRDGSARLPISEMFGPNPANDIVNNSDVFLGVLEKVMDDVFMPRFMHELSRLLPAG